MWLHGSCADITEGICGSWNGNAADDLAPTNNINAMADSFKEYDENCPAPPKPWDPCEDIGPDARAEALEMCSPLNEPGICHFVKYFTITINAYGIYRLGQNKTRLKRMLEI